MRIPRPGIRTTLRRLTAPGDVKKLHDTFRRHPKSQHILGFDDCVALYRLVRKLKPGLVVEFGSGIGTGTAMIAAALEANGRGEVISLEHLDFLRDTAEEIIPKSLLERVQIVIAEAEVRGYFGMDWACYRWQLDRGPVDVVMIDGPPTEGTDRSGAPVLHPNGDLIDLLPFLSESAAVFVDGRQRSVECYRQFLADRLEFVGERRGLSEFRVKATRNR